VVALVNDSGQMVEWAKYSSYGVPFGLPAGDTDSDGDADVTDSAQINTWINTSTYDVRGDLDLDGDVDATDATLFSSGPSGESLGRGTLSRSDVSNRKGYAGYENDENIVELYHVRHRVLNTTLGRWVQRDPSGSSPPTYLYGSAKSWSRSGTNPMGLLQTSRAINQGIGLTWKPSTSISGGISLGNLGTPACPIVVVPFGMESALTCQPGGGPDAPGDCVQDTDNYSDCINCCGELSDPIDQVECSKKCGQSFEPGPPEPGPPGSPNPPTAPCPPAVTVTKVLWNQSCPPGTTKVAVLCQTWNYTELGFLKTTKANEYHCITCAKGCSAGPSSPPTPPPPGQQGPWTSCGKPKCI